MDHDPSRRSTLLAAALIAVSAVGATSCDRLFSTKIANIEGDLVKYDGTTVIVRGKVTERIDLPMLKCYVVNDGTGAIGVVTHKALPHVGDVVSAKGKVQSSFKLGKRALVAIVEPAPPAPATPKPAPPGALPS